MAYDFTGTIGTITSGGKVHLAHGFGQRQSICCRFGSAPEYTTNTLAELADDSDTCDALLNAEVKMSRLCKHCFSPRFRSRYQARIRRAVAECTD